MSALPLKADIVSAFFGNLGAAGFFFACPGLS
jgi:hypothetical protein